MRISSVDKASGSTSRTLGFAGLGHMGSGMAKRLLKGGWDLIVFDQDAEAVELLVESGAARAISPKDLAARADVILACFPSPELLHSVMLDDDGVIHGGRARYVIDHSAAGPRASAAIAAELRKASITMVDAAVSGNPEKALDGKLMLMVSGSTESVDAMRTVLEAVSKRIIVLGDKPGLGQYMKLVYHFLSATALAASAEATILGVKAGIDPVRMLEVLNNGSGKNSATLDKIPNNVRPGTFDHGFSTDLLYTDIRRYVEEAEALEVPIWIGVSVRQQWFQSMQKSVGLADVTRVFELLEGWSNTTVRTSVG